MNVVQESSMQDARAREAATTIPVYGQLPFVPDHTSGCDIVASDGRRILDLYGGHAVAALGYGHPRLLAAIREQSETMLFQSNAVALDVRANAAEKLVEIAPDGLESVFFVNSGAEANENALRMACAVTGRPKVLAITGGFHGRTAAAGAVTWKSERWYGFPRRPFDVDFIPRDDCDAARAMIGPDVAAVIFEPVQGVAGAFDLSCDFVQALREETSRHGALLIADEVQSGVGRCGYYFAVQAHGLSPDILTSAKALGGGIPCGAVICRKEIADRFGVGDLGTTFGGGPVAAGAIVAVLETIEAENLLQNVRDRATQLRASCLTGPVEKIQGMGLLLGLVCKQPAAAVRDALLEHGILAGTSADPHVLRILAPLVITAEHVQQLATALASISCEQD
jgi:acetylornithine/succinyldiaminopimelate/putrescine aminotransferase